MQQTRDRDPLGYYVLLGVQPGASADQIRGAYRLQASFWHPDKNAKPEAHERMAKINLAYRTLIDPVSRYDYDHKTEPPTVEASVVDEEDEEENGFDSWVSEQWEWVQRYQEVMRKSPQTPKPKAPQPAPVVTKPASPKVSKVWFVLKVLLVSLAGFYVFPDSLPIRSLHTALTLVGMFYILAGPVAGLCWQQFPEKRRTADRALKFLLGIAVLYVAAQVLIGLILGLALAGVIIIGMIGLCGFIMKAMGG